MNYDSLLLEPLENLPPTTAGDGTLVSLSGNRGLYVLDDGIWSRVASAHSLPVFCSLSADLSCVLPELEHAACFSGHLTLNNYSDADQTVSLFFKAAGDSKMTELLNQVPVTSTESLTIDINTALPKGGSLYAYASSGNSVSLCTALSFNEASEGIPCTATTSGVKLHPSVRSSFKEVVLCNVSAGGVNPKVSLAISVGATLLPLVSNVALDDAITLLANFSSPVLDPSDYVLLTSSVENSVSAIVTFG